MNTIYIVTPGGYMEDVLDGFATNVEEIKQIIRNHFEEWMCDIRIDYINVDLTRGAVFVHYEDYCYEDYCYEGGREYTIHTVERAAVK